MNQLSWLLYWADVLPGFAVGVFIIALLSCVPLSVMLFYYFTEGSEVWTRDVYDEKSYRTGKKVTVPTDDALKAQKFGWSRQGLGLALAVALLMNFVPSKDTFYLIAASEAGEQALTTPEAAKIRAVINKWLDDAVKTEETE